MSIFVNGTEITEHEVNEEIQYHPADSVASARHQAAQALVIRQLLLQEAQKKNLLDEPLPCSPEKAAEVLDVLLQQEITVPEADKKSCLRYYEQNKERFIDKKTGKLLPPDSVIEHIRDYLHARSLKTGISQYIKVLSGQAKIVGFELEGTDSPLVQ